MLAGVDCLGARSAAHLQVMFLFRRIFWTLYALLHCAHHTLINRIAHCARADGYSNTTLALHAWIRAKTHGTALRITPVCAGALRATRTYLPHTHAARTRTARAHLLPPHCLPHHHVPYACFPYHIASLPLPLPPLLSCAVPHSLPHIC